ncbi:hypothetical protein WK77_16865 [Burkholderia ubonensis]|nr:hypothetical protein WK77_16865 [Burkholderia ubonensis]
MSVPAGVERPAFFASRDIKVLDYHKGPGGLNAWSVERNGVQTVLYTTADNKVLMSGVLWDAKSGVNLSDAFLKPSMIQSSTVQAADAGGAPTRASAGAVSVPIAAVAALRGIKEGNGAAIKTVYILFDPRCPHCKNVYRDTRDFVRNGGSIKWIPTTVLGRDQMGTAMVADILQAPNPIEAMRRVESGGFRQPGKIEQSTLDAIRDNEEYFWAAFDRNKGAGVPGVPVAFFQTADGAPQMVANLDDRELLNRIFKDMGK